MAEASLAEQNKECTEARRMDRGFLAKARPSPPGNPIHLYADAYEVLRPLG